MNIADIINEANENSSMGRFSSASKLYRTVSDKLFEEEPLDGVYFLYRSSVESNRAEDKNEMAKNLMTLGIRSLNVAANIYVSNLGDTDVEEQESSLHNVYDILTMLGSDDEKKESIKNSLLQLYPKILESNIPFEKKMHYVIRYLKLGDEGRRLSAEMIHKHIRDNIGNFDDDEYEDPNKIGLAYHIIKGCELYNKLGDRDNFVDLYSYLFRLNVMGDLEFDNIPRYSESTLGMHETEIIKNNFQELIYV